MKDFDEMIRRLEYVVAFNDKRKSLFSGSNLTETDVLRLIMLKDAFTQCFPDKAHNFRKGLLRSLGELLIGKPLPQRNPDNQIEKL